MKAIAAILGAVIVFLLTPTGEELILIPLGIKLWDGWKNGRR